MSKRWAEAAKDAGPKFEAAIRKSLECPYSECPFWRGPNQCVADSCIRLRD